MNYNSETVFLGHFHGDQIVDVLKENLKTCDSFSFSVSFIMDSGLPLLLDDIKEALKRGAKGTIVTTDYMRLTSVGCLKTFLDLMSKYKNFTAYLIETKGTEYSTFHTKGYMFVKDNTASIIIGSSNMSKAALTKDGGEWSLFSKTATNVELFKDVNDEFDSNIKEIGGGALTQQQIDKYAQTSLPMQFGTVSPNYMQQEALKALNDARTLHSKNSALIVAAMGSGKTYLAAFDAKNYKANHVLYICHSETILNSARIEFENVFSNEKTYGMFVGGEKNNKADIIFGTNQSVYKHLTEFDKNYFDYIIVDEAHHTPATTFKGIVEYFNYGFLLGMTGTPDRMDQQDVKKMFSNTIPFELSLRDAIEKNLIMPFKYYAVSDKFVDYSTKTSGEQLIKDIINTKDTELDSSIVSFFSY